jgi:hypothetical protein
VIISETIETIDRRRATEGRGGRGGDVRGFCERVL